MAISLFSFFEPWFDVIFPIPISGEGQGGLSKGTTEGKCNFTKGCLPIGVEVFHSFCTLF